MRIRGGYIQGLNILSGGNFVNFVVSNVGRVYSLEFFVSRMAKLIFAYYNLTRIFLWGRKVRPVFDVSHRICI